MAKFSVPREEDDEDPLPESSRPPYKRLRFSRSLLFQLGSEQEQVEGDEEEEDGEQEEEEEDEDTQDEDFAVNGEAEASEGNSENSEVDGSISVTLTDPHVLDCPICFDVLCAPVYQCENGHLACMSCCTKIGNRCPSCSLPIGYNRCRAIENVVDSLMVPCQNKKYGCGEQVIYGYKQDHEMACIHAPCPCPFLPCNYLGSVKKLSVHVRTKHLNSTWLFQFNEPFNVSFEKNTNFLVLQEKNEGMLFILSNKEGPDGNRVTVSCLGPSSSDTRYSYELFARKRTCSLKLQSLTKTFPTPEFLAECFVVIPPLFLCSNEPINLRVLISPADENPSNSDGDEEE
ncbi:Seven-in-absentia protein, TRAF-like domain [Dillenia turbinata]|uniref:RING-type E3 ubiquitin transferase n=1 Tax=Dillenia turbinata TaxID=194707 RepID=A0AAN8ZA45_9MAGN